MDACSLAENDSIMLHVEPSWAAGFDLAGFNLSDTISYVLEKIIKKVKEIGMLCPQPEKGLRLTLLSGPYLEQDTTLASAVKLADVNDKGPINTINVMLLRPLLDRNGELLWIPERKDLDMFGEPSSTEEDDEESEDDEVCPVYYKGKRGKEPKFAVRPNLGIHGDIKLLDENDQPISLSQVWNIDSIVTTASAVLLAPNDRILNNLYALNEKEKGYVVLGIGIDLLSYVFLRLLRECFPDMPILAVTDLDPAHLDIIAFLDSDVGVVRRLFNLDLMNYEISASNVSHIDDVDIKWLGFRCSQRGSLLSEADFEALSLPPSTDFDKFIRRLLKNLNVTWKNSWFRELILLKKFHRCMEFPSSGYACIASMISKEEWA